MKLLLASTMLILLTGCSDPTPLGDGAAQAFQSCLEKGWKARYFSNGIKVDFTCKPYKTPVPMSADVSNVMQACIAKDKNAVYNPSDGMVICVEKGGDIQLSD